MRFAVIGHPVAHSLSPLMHTANFRALGFDGEYEKIDVDPQELPAAMRRFAAEGYRGINCTIPHKMAVMPLLTRLDESARRCGAVNTVRFEEDGSTTGFNTDAGGFAVSLAEALSAGRSETLDLAGAKVLLLGAGGAARAVAVACMAAGCAQLVIANRTFAKAEALVATLRAHGGDFAISAGAWPDEAAADVVVNATPVGLKAEDAPVLPEGAWRAGQTVCDLIPVRRETATLAAARRAGARTVDGLGMLAAQGAEAFRIWTGLKPDLAAFRNALKSSL